MKAIVLAGLVTVAAGGQQAMAAGADVAVLPNHTALIDAPVIEFWDGVPVHRPSISPEALRGLAWLGMGRDGCSMVFEGDRSVVHRGTERSRHLFRTMPQNFGPDTNVYRWKSVLRSYQDQPCTAVQPVR